MIDLFDGHCDTIERCYLSHEGFRSNTGHLDLVRTRKFGRYAQFFAIFIDADGVTGPLDQVYREELALFQRELASNGDLVSFCRCAAQAEEAFAAGRSAAFLSVEGAELLGCSLEGLERAHRDGVRMVNLTWNHANALSGSNADRPGQGLTERGRAFVARMEELGMLVDVSHLSDPGFWDVMAATTAPVVASHSNARNVFFDIRNLTDEQFTAIIERNGVAGLNLYAGFLGEAPGLDTVISHLEHFLALGGAGHISIGGDWDGCAPLPRGMDGIQDLDRLYELLLRRNYSEELVRGVFYTNLMRVVSEVCSM